MFQKSKEKPAWRTASRVNEVNGVNEVPFRGSLPSVRRSDKMAPAGGLDKADKIDKVDPEGRTRLTLLTSAGRGVFI